MAHKRQAGFDDTDGAVGGKRVKPGQPQQQQQPQQRASSSSSSCNSGAGSCTLHAGAPPTPHLDDVSRLRSAHGSSIEEAEFECSICTSLLVDPVVGVCGHDYCRSCLEERMSSHSCIAHGTFCPTCQRCILVGGVACPGICLRLQRLIQRLFPERLAERRLEVAAQQATRAALRQLEISRQLDAVSALLQQRLQQQAAAAPAPPSPAAHAPTAAPTSWHAPLADLPHRHATAAALLRLFYSRRPAMAPPFCARLPVLVVKLEEALYRAAASRQQYGDAATLEARVQQLVQRLAHARAAAAAAHAADPAARPPSGDLSADAGPEGLAGPWGMSPAADDTHPSATAAALLDQVDVAAQPLGQVMGLPVPLPAPGTHTPSWAYDPHMYGPSSHSANVWEHWCER